MNHFERIEKALEYIDDHLDEALRLDEISCVFHFSPYYFHRMFSAVVGRPINAYMRERRLEKACRLLKQSRESVLAISLSCGFSTSQAFCRAFKRQIGMSPTQYRNEPGAYTQLTAQELVDAFRRKLRGGIFVEPRIISRPVMHIAGVSGDGRQTAAIWQKFMALNEKKAPSGALSKDGYEIRICQEDGQTCHVGLSVSGEQNDTEYNVLTLQSSLYAAFDVYVAEGYDSQNGAMNEWLNTHTGQYTQRRLNGQSYVVEYYDERFHGDASDSIVEIWVPIKEIV